MHREILDFNKIKSEADEGLQDMIEARKKDFGLEKSVDMVARAEESIKVGDETVTLAQILAQIEGVGPGTGRPGAPAGPPPSAGRELSEEDLQPGSFLKPADNSQPPPPEVKKAIQFYGIYVVRRGDNLWNIHFAILREYLKYRGIELAEDADARKVAGASSGVARILKYAEKMVYIFNMKTRTLDTNLSLLEPDEKVIIFNLTRLEKILGQVTARNIDSIIYDGQNLYLPGQEPETAPAGPSG
ncbi:MAG: hypothetical protein AB1896_21810 [Thermodesulfobacteriota bacterium]